MKAMIERLGHRGDGIAEGPVYAPLTLPGEVVEGDVVDGRMILPRILTPSPDRVRPPCPHFKSCGGCALQHASDPFVEQWKAQVVRDALGAQGVPAPIRSVIISAPQSRRRAVFSARRTRKGALLGFHARASNILIDTPNCLLVVPEITSLRPVLQDIAVTGGSRKGELSITVTASPGGADVSVMNGKPADAGLQQELARIVSDSTSARLSWNGETVAQRQPPWQETGGIRFTPPPGAFLQATKAGEATLIASVRQTVKDARCIADLFAGCGTFTLPLARQAEVHAVESGSDMLAALDSGWRCGTGMRKVTTESRDLFRRPLIVDELNGYDAVVIDPPRAGARAQVAELAASTVPRIAMVSCNPASFARDAKVLTDAGLTLAHIDVVDQFRWSTHVELSAQFTRQ